MPRSKKNKSKSNATRIRGTAILTAPSNMSSTGLLQIDRYEIDTSLVSSWVTLASVFQRWKIHSLTFRFIPLLANTYNGMVFMAMLEDPESNTPVVEADIMNNRIAIMNGVREPIRLHYKPKHEFWLFTNDLVSQTDRLEMPGDFIFATSAGTSSVNPGRIVLHYDVTFDLVTNSVVSLSTHIETQIEKRVKEELEKKLKTLTL